MTIKIVFKRHQWAMPTFILMSDCPSVDHAISAFKQSCPGLEFVRALCVDSPLIQPAGNNSFAALMRRSRGEE